MFEVLFLVTEDAVYRKIQKKTTISPFVRYRRWMTKFIDGFPRQLQIEIKMLWTVKKHSNRRDPSTTACLFASTSDHSVLFQVTY